MPHLTAFASLRDAKRSQFKRLILLTIRAGYQSVR